MIKSAKVWVHGRKVGVRKSAGRWRAQVDLRGFPKGRFVVKIEIKTTDGRTLTRRPRLPDLHAGNKKPKL